MLISTEFTSFEIFYDGSVLVSKPGQSLTLSKKDAWEFVIRYTAARQKIEIDNKQRASGEKDD